MRSPKAVIFDDEDSDDDEKHVKVLKSVVSPNFKYVLHTPASLQPNLRRLSCPPCPCCLSVA